MSHDMVNSNAEHLNFMQTVGSLFQSEAMDKAKQALAMQIDSKEDLEAQQKSETPQVQLKKQAGLDKSLEARTSSVKKTESVLVAVEDKEAAEQFTQKDHHPEFSSKDLVSLKQLVLEIKPPITKEKILKLVSEKYPNSGMLDSALEFLEITNKGSPEILKAVKELRQENYEKNKESVVSNRNIAPYAHVAETVHLGSFQENIDLHMQVLTEAPQASQLLSMLFDKYQTYEKVKFAAKFLNKSVGETLRASEGTDRSKMSSIEPGELHALMAEIKTLRQITGVGRFVSDRMAITEAAADAAGIAA